MSYAAPATSASVALPTVRLRTTRLRITARGRKVLAALIALPLLAALGLAAMFAGGSAVATGGTSSVEFEYVTVKAGQSLWAIAETLAPEADPRDTIAQIMNLNQLTQSSVQPGQRIAIPTTLAD